MALKIEDKRRVRNPAGRRSKVDWTAARDRWIMLNLRVEDGDYTLVALAADVGVTVSTVRGRAGREKWRALLEARRQELSDKVMEEFSIDQLKIRQQQMERAVRMMDLSEEIQSKISEMLKEGKLGIP